MLYDFYVSVLCIFVVMVPLVTCVVIILKNYIMWTMFNCLLGCHHDRAIVYLGILFYYKFYVISVYVSSICCQT